MCKSRTGYALKQFYFAIITNMAIAADAIPKNVIHNNTFESIPLSNSPMILLLADILILVLTISEKKCF